jgi:ornithine--oxo-acid transaminase
MSFDLKTYLAGIADQGRALHLRHVNHQLVKVLQVTGFEKDYTHAEGCWLFDAEGRRYLDFLSGFGVFALGRNHPVVKRALKDAIDMDLPNLVQFERHPLAGALAARLAAKAGGGLEKVFLTNSGAESIEGAIKFARAATKRAKILAATHAFHGLTTGALSLNGSADFKEGFGPLLPGVKILPFGDADAFVSEISKGDVAAVVLEVIQGKGVHLAAEGFFEAVGESCRRHGTVLVIDEVQTGLGRTGRFFSFEHYGIRPDIVTVSKALSGGFVPVGAIIMRPEIHRAVYSSLERAVVHSSTFSQNLLAMVAGLATLSVIEEEGLVEQAEATGRLLMERLSNLTERYELFKEVRGKGLMIGLVFGEPSTWWLKSKFAVLELAHKGLFSQMVVSPLFTRHGVITQVAGNRMNVVKILPPLVAGQEEVDYFLGALEEVLSDLHRRSLGLFGLGGRFVKAALSRPR